MIPVVTPKILKHLFPQLLWEVNTQDNNIYLTFDDGPEPEITSQVLAFLLKYNARATFFCLGENAEKHPDIIQKIKNNGHAVANHGYKHLNGYITHNNTYIQNFKKGAALTNIELFRPPYGRITPNQIKTIKLHTKIVLWSIMSKDYSKKISPEKCIRNVLDNVFPGAIIVFHDTIKASPRLLKALPIILESLHEKGYNFKTLC